MQEEEDHIYIGRAEQLGIFFEGEKKCDFVIYWLFDLMKISDDFASWS